jgi:hypothetical protein
MEERRREFNGHELWLTQIASKQRVLFGNL